MKLSRTFCLAGVAILLSGCGASSEDELRSWMLDQRNQMRPRVAPISEPKPFKPEDYVDTTAVDPFSKEKLTAALKRDTGQAATLTSALIAPELARRKEALEAFPLDAMSMVGSLIQQGQPAALIRVDNLLYQVRLGSYLGTNYGKVTRISETEVTLREIVQDAVGEWIERPATLQLQERVK
ncbi:MAG: pilus assembly protein PilP [Hylemonella sp.]|uniref:pilus assembly protein PilP n=1 Tax=Hylemonella sp. TaxID=2066020 RepID=UPI00391DFCA4